MSLCVWLECRPAVYTTHVGLCVWLGSRPADKPGRKLWCQSSASDTREVPAAVRLSLLTGWWWQHWLHWSTGHGEQSVTLLPARLKQVKGVCSSSWEPVTELWSITCHTGSHSVTCRATRMNVPALTPARQSGTQFTFPYFISERWHQAQRIRVWYDTSAKDRLALWVFKR